MDRFFGRLGYRLGLRRIADKSGVNYHTVSRLLKGGPPAGGTKVRLSTHNVEILDNVETMMDERIQELLDEIKEINAHKPVLRQWKKALLGEVTP
ncbi:hypothetical protein FAES_3910 [Fibrella aestuarina BUZ 2]|uniref:Uncharacterized protein n=1 Tax=Fibrella aestuarina BUZ 2 TaxID=1166018 RepID=I0KCR3_9BACT|nr:hypothetical protein [Fibrella aestuarina]CCH01916.1 hypothetical protein FAES_3910 [Fibrella aestuarina BUZ 2]